MKGCGIARDLMPLVLDEAANEESREFVETHTAECAECRAYYEAMQRTQEDAKQKQADEAAALIAAKKLKKQRRRRVLAGVCTVIVIGVLIIGLIVGGVKLLYTDTNSTMGLDEYEIVLSRLEDGRIIISPIPDDRELFCLLSFHCSGDGVLYMNYETSILRHKGYRNNDFEIFDAEQYTTLAKGKAGKSEVVYTVGDDVPPASEEMELYFEAYDKFNAYVDETKHDSDTEMWEAMEAMTELVSRMNELGREVPEWQ